MKIISLINQKGGVGKTTSAISIASLLGKDKKVLLIDLDPQGNATSNSGINKRELKMTTKELFLEDKITAEECVVKTGKSYDLIGSNLDTANTEINLISKINREYILKKKLKILTYDYIIIDCSPNIKCTCL